jgi:hypothetical protein
VKPSGRVVLDANYFREAKLEHLAPIRERGFRVSVGFSALQEAWAAAAREDKPGLLLGPTRRLRGIVDPDYPIAPTSGDLLRRFAVERRGRDVDPLSHRYRAWATSTWQTLSQGAVDVADVQRIGRLINAHLDKRGGKWTGYARRWSDIQPDDPNTDADQLTEEERKALAKYSTVDDQLAFFRSLSPGKRLAQYVRFQTKGITEHGLRVRMVRGRLHAFFHVVGLRSWTTASGATTATANDSEDITSLMHIAEPAFLLTHDTKLIESVDASGSYQAPWVLRLQEFLGGPLPLGRPWGIGARLQAAHFRRPAASSA